jgi:hypothetical protein
VPPLRLSRAPRTDDELHLLIKAMFGISLPRRGICEGHTSPFAAVAHAYFSREPNFAVWYASRGSGKSLALAVLGLVKAFVADVDVTILGGSSWQSANVRAHMSKMLKHPNAPTYAVSRDIATVIETTTGKQIQPLPASQTSVRGPHPPLQLLDEIDEMEYAIYEAALGQAMEQLNTRGEIIGEYIVASSTWQNPIGTMTTVIEDARDKGLPVFTWCWRELLAENGGWMSQRFIDAKKRTVSASMWKTEYELNEPVSSSRAFDLDKIDQYFIEYPEPVRERHELNDDTWVWEKPDPLGVYAAGADWAKEIDKTVLVVLRVDCHPRRVVALRRMNRTSYEIMTSAFTKMVREYNNAESLHDKTGVGNGLNDFLGEDARAGYVLVGRKRSQIFSNYIADFEHGGYLLPKKISEKDPFHRAHRGATVADVFAPAQWNEHTPDDVVAMALAHHAGGRSPIPGDLPEMPKDPTPRDVDKQFHVQPTMDRTEGLVSVVDESWGDDMMDAMSVGMRYDNGDVGGWLS